MAAATPSCYGSNAQSVSDAARNTKAESVYDDTAYSATTGESLGGIVVYKPLGLPDQQMLQSMYDAVLVKMRDLYEDAMAKKDIFWVRLPTCCLSEKRGRKRRCSLPAHSCCFLNGTFCSVFS